MFSILRLMRRLVERELLYKYGPWTIFIRAHLCLVPIVASVADKIRVNWRNSRIKPFPVSAFPPSAFRFSL